MVVPELYTLKDTMSAWSIPPLLLASINVFLAAHYSVIHLRTRASREPLTFAALALALGVYDVCCAFLYDAASPAAARPWQLAQYGTLTVGALVLVAFVADYTRRPLGRDIAVIGVAFGLLWSAVLVGGTTLLVTRTPLIRDVALPFGLRETLVEMAAGPLAPVHDIIGLGVFASVFRAAGAHYRAGHRGRATRLMAVIGVFFVAAVNDAALGLGLIRSVYLIEYAFMGVVVLMADSLSKDLVRAGRAVEALARSERNYHEVFDATNDVIIVHDARTGAILDANQAMCGLYGFSCDEARHLSIGDISAGRPPFTEEVARARLRQAMEEGPQVFEWLARRRDGGEIWVEVSLRATTIGGEGRVLAVARDIGERKRAAEALVRSEDRFRSLVQHSYDYITVLDADGTVTYATPSASAALGYGSDGLIGHNAFDLVHPDDRDLAVEAFKRTGWGTPTGRPLELRLRRADGSWLHVEGLGSNLLEHPAIQGILVNTRDVTERWRAEESMKRTLRELKVLNAVAQAAVAAGDEDELIARVTEVVRGALFPDDCGVLLLDETEGVLRFTPSYVRGPGAGAATRAPIPLGTGVTGHVARTGTTVRVDDVTADARYLANVDGMRSELCAPLTLGARPIGVFNAESRSAAGFSESDEHVLTTVCGQLSTAIGRLRAARAHHEAEERFRRLAESAFEGIGIHDEGRIVDANTQLAEMLGYQLPEIIGRHVMEFVAPASAEEVSGFIRAGREDLYEHLAVRKDGSVFPVETQGKPLGRGSVRVAAVRDITERKRAERQIRRQFARLSALRTIDATITAGLELPATVDVVLDTVLAQLHVEAALVLRLDPATWRLVPVAGRGLPETAASLGGIPVGEGGAGKAAAGRKLVALPDLAAEASLTPLERQLAGDGLRSAFAAPLVAKQDVHGVLEVFRAAPGAPDAEWVNYLETIASQLAIAVDSRTLLESLERSNADLARAYDTTLEGWSRALELRDRETQGHCARVVELTVGVARAIGMRDDDLVHIRRGVLLHDIGKMAIPDSILFKPGPLSEDEWAVMKRHPQLAYDLLFPIEFLRPALEIPLCHHEWWDGSGYPLGLEGEAIPLAARIFAVADSWDGLSYRRPYREPWPAERVREHIAAEAGTHFDPRVAEVFLSVVSRSAGPATR